MALKYVQTLTLYQAGAGNIIGATTVVLTSLTDIYGNAITTMTPFGTKGYITLEPDTSNEEAASFTGITVNANGTVSLTGISTVLAQSPYTETSGLVRQHSGGTKVVITDNVAFWNTFANKVNDETITGRWGSATVPSANNDYANKLYVDGVAIAGAPDAATGTKGVTRLSVAPVSPTIPIAVGDNDYRVVNYFTETGAANAYVITPSPSIGTYATGQRFSFKAVNANTIASTLNINALGTKAIVNSKGGALVANDILAGMIVTVEYDGTSMVMQNPVANTPTVAATTKFGGTGVDGALAISSGATNIDLAGARVLVKNYTSISITGTGSLTFTNPHANGTTVVILSQGAVTLTSSTAPMIDCSKLGGLNGAATVGANAGSVGGNIGTEGQSFIYQSNPGAGAGGAAIASGGAISTGVKFVSQTTYLLSKYADVFVGSGGGSGSANDITNDATAPTGGRGGRGGGALIIECGGAWNFTTALGISVAGENGQVGVAAGTGSSAAGAGGGGSAGYFRALYNTLTANSGTINVSAGTGANSVSTFGISCYGGAGGGNPLAAGSASGQAGTDGTKIGGDGAAGFSATMINTLFV